MWPPGSLQAPAAVREARPGGPGGDDHVTVLCRTATGKGGPCHESGVCGPCGSPEVPTLVRIQRTYSMGAVRVSDSNGE